MKNNKTLFAFCLKIVVLFVVLFCVDRMVGAAFVCMKTLGLERNPENMWLKTPYTVEKVKTDIVVIGSSKATHNYIPDTLSHNLHMNAYNCGQDGCFFLYQNCIINMILDRYTPKVILWDIQPESFIKNDVADEYQNIRYLTPYYRRSQWVKHYIDSESPKMPIRMLSEMYGYNSKLLNYIFPLVTHASSTKHGYIPLPSFGYAYPRMKLESQNEDVEVSPDFLTFLDKTLKRCRLKGCDVRLCISPVYLKKSALTRHAEESISRIADINDVRYMNYHSDSKFMVDSTLFKDAHHLNDCGAKKFTKIICGLN